MFSNKDLRKLLIPLIIEQVLTSLMGAIDVLMVTNLGSAPVSGVSSVDTINTLVLFLFSALATGGTVVCSQYLGRKMRNDADNSARQLILSALALSIALMVVALALNNVLLNLIFGGVDADVMAAARVYFYITAMSYPFIALFNCGAALYRASGNSRLPMIISVVSNCINIILNYLFMFVFDFGVAGAAAGTLISRIFSAGIILALLRRPNQEINVGSYLKIRPDKKVMKRVLYIGLPTGVENAMFQLGKILVQSTVSTLGTAAIASNAVIVVLENLTSMPSMAIGLGLITVAGQCIGAGRLDEAKQYIKKLTLYGAVVLLVFNWTVFGITPLITNFAKIDASTAALTISVMLMVSIAKPVLWPLAFIPANGMRAAGDVKFNMLVSTASMWVFRVVLTTVLCRYCGFGLHGIWIGYIVDWAVRSVAYSLRLRSGKWANHHVI